MIKILVYLYMEFQTPTPTNIYLSSKRDTLTGSGRPGLKSTPEELTGGNRKFETLRGYLAKSKALWTTERKGKSKQKVRRDYKVSCE